MGADSPSINPSQASARNTEEGERFNRTLFAALDALEEGKIPYALIGGVAASGLGRPRSTHDIDVFLRPEDAHSALESLERFGFTTEKTDVKWLFKAFKENILVDIVFKSHGDIYFDEEMFNRSVHVNFHGRNVRVVSPEDLVIIKCAVANEGGPHHWHDALAVLSHAAVDWDYLLRRGRRATRRLLSLLVYAQSNDIWVPNTIITQLFTTIFGGESVSPSFTPSSTKSPPQAAAPLAKNVPTPRASVNALPNVLTKAEPEEYLAGRLVDALACDERTGENSLKVKVEQGHVLVTGEVQSEAQRKAIEALVRDLTPEGYIIDHRVNVRVIEEPQGAEEIV